jgi:hypothetical protein
MWFLVLVLIILLCMYAYNIVIQSMKYNEEYQILQLKPSQLDEAIIEERNPIVIETTDVVNDVLLSPVIKDKCKKVRKTEKDVQSVSKARLKAFSYNKDGSAVVEIITPKHAKMDKKDEEYKSMSIILRKGHVLLLPCMWHFVSDKALTTVDIHDWQSTIYSFVM